MIWFMFVCLSVRSEAREDKVSGGVSARQHRGLRLGTKTLQQVHVVQGAQSPIYLLNYLLINMS